MSGNTKESLALLAAAGTGIQVGAAIVATRFVVDQTGPASLALLRYAIGFLCLLPFVAAAGRIKIEPRDMLPIALLGTIQFGILIALLNWGLRHVTSARAALIFATFPLLTLLLAALLGREKLSFAKTCGVLLTIAGVGLALAERLGAGSGSSEEWLGALSVFGAALSGAVCSILYRPYLAKYPTLPVSALAMLASVGFLAVLAVGEGFFAAPPNFTPGGIAAIVFIGVSSGVFYYVWLWALGHTSPTKATVFLTLSPVTATLLGAAFLDEALTPMILLALVAVGAGLWLALRPVSSP